MSDPIGVPVEEPEDPGSLTETVVRGASLSGAGFALAQSLNLAVYVVLARLLSPHEFGVFAGGSVLFGFALLATDSGMVAALIQRRDRVEEAANTVLVATALGGFLFGLLALACAPLIGLIFHSSEVTSVAAAMSGMVFVRTLGSVPNALLQREFSFLRRLAVEPIQVVVFGAASIIAAVLGLGVWSLVLGQYVGAIVDVALCWFFIKWRPNLRLASFHMWRELVRYGRYLLISGVVFWANEQGSAVIVGRFLGTSALGQFRNGFRLAVTPLRMLVAAASYVLFPAFSRIAHDAERLAPAFMRSLRWMCIVAMPAGLLLLPLGHPLAVIVFGDQWGPAGDVTGAMGIWAGAGAVVSVVSEVLKAWGDTKKNVQLVCVNTPLTLAAMLAMIPAGLTGVAYGLSIGAVLSAAYSLRVVSTTLDLPLRPMLGEIWAPFTAAAIMALILLPIDRSLDPASHRALAGLAMLTVEAAAGLALYAAALRLLAPASAQELFLAARGLLQRRRARRMTDASGSVS